MLYAIVKAASGLAGTIGKQDSGGNHRGPFSPLVPGKVAYHNRSYNLIIQEILISVYLAMTQSMVFLQ